MMSEIVGLFDVFFFVFFFSKYWDSFQRLFLEQKPMSGERFFFYIVVRPSIKKNPETFIRVHFGNKTTLKDNLDFPPTFPAKSRRFISVRYQQCEPYLGLHFGSEKE